MAITITQQPDTFCLSGNTQLFLLESTNGSQPNFKFIVDIYDYTGGTQIVPRIKLNYSGLNGGTANAFVDLHRITSSFLMSSAVDFEVPVSYGMAPISTNDNSIYGYVVKVGEEYGSTPVSYPALEVATVTYQINSTLNDVDAFGFSQDTYILGTTTRKFLKDPNIGTSTNPIKLKDQEHYTLYYIVNQTNTAKKLRVVVTDDLGAQTSYTIESDHEAISSPAKRHQRCLAGYNLNNIDASTYSISPHPIIRSDTVSWYVFIQNSSGDQVSERVYFEKDTTCTKYEVYRFHWLNKLGGYDTWTFNRASQKFIDIDRKFFKKPDYTTAYNAKVSRYKTQYNTKYQDRIVVESDWITEDEAVFLRELYASPDVWLQTSSTMFVPYNVISASYEEKQAARDKLFNVSIEVSPSYKTNIQNR